MKICLFTDSDVFAGTERHMLDLAMALRASGVDVLIAGPDDGTLARRARLEGIKVISVKKHRLPDLGAIKSIKNLMLNGVIDIVHCHNGRTAFIAVLARIMAGRGQVVITQHFIDPSRTNAKGFTKFIKTHFHRWIHRETSKVIAISKAVAEGIKARKEAQGSKIAQIWNGICDPQLKLRSGIKCESHVKMQGTYRILCPARLESEKGHQHLIKALGLLNENDRNWVCNFVGEGSLRFHLESVVHSAGLASQVNFLGFREDVYDLMHESDLVVLPSPDEPFGLVLIEAMALCKPVIAISAGGPLEIVKDDYSGFLVPAEDTVALAAALRRLTSVPSLGISMGSAGRKLFEDNFTSARMAVQTALVYKSAMKPDLSARRSKLL